MILFLRRQYITIFLLLFSRLLLRVRVSIVTRSRRFAPLGNQPPAIGQMLILAQSPRSSTASGAKVALPLFTATSTAYYYCSFQPRV